MFQINGFFLLFSIVKTFLLSTCTAPRTDVCQKLEINSFFQAVNISSLYFTAVSIFHDDDTRSIIYGHYGHNILFSMNIQAICVLYHFLPAVYYTVLVVYQQPSPHHPYFPVSVFPYKISLIFFAYFLLYFILIIQIFESSRHNSKATVSQA